VQAVTPGRRWPPVKREARGGGVVGTSGKIGTDEGNFIADKIAAGLIGAGAKASLDSKLPLGVLGLSGDFKSSDFDRFDFNPSKPPTTVGIQGIAQDGAGVVGISLSGRGGIFESVTEAQLKLVPIDRDSPSFKFPSDGQTGDLLVVTSKDIGQLWFCDKGQSGNTGARWSRIALSGEVVQT
jgi:hypothetical protein